MANINGEKTLHDGTENCWHVLSHSGGDYDGLIVTGEYSTSGTTIDNFKITCSNLTNKLHNASGDGKYDYSCKLYLICVGDSVPKSISGSDVSDNSNKRFISSQLVGSTKTIELHTFAPGTQTWTGTNITKNDDGLTAGKWCFAMWCGQKGGCDLGYLVYTKVSDYIIVPPSPPTVNDVLIGDTIKASNRNGCQYGYCTQGSETYTEWKTYKELTPTKNNLVTKFRYRNYVNGAPSSIVYAQTQLRPPYNVSYKDSYGNVNGAIEYGKEIEWNDYTNDSNNISKDKLKLTNKTIPLTTNYTGQKYLTAALNDIVTDDYNYVPSEVSNGSTAAKVKIKCQTPIVQILGSGDTKLVDDTTSEKVDHVSAEMPITTHIVTESYNSPKPTTKNMNYYKTTWVQKTTVSPSTLTSFVKQNVAIPVSNLTGILEKGYNNGSMQIHYEYPTDGSGSLLNSDTRTFNYTVWHCPRNMNNKGYTVTWYYGVDEDNLTQLTADSNIPPNMNIYISLPSFGLLQNNGNFNYYVLSIVTITTNDDGTTTEKEQTIPIAQGKISEDVKTESIIAKILSLGNSSQIPLGTLIKLKLYCSYYDSENIILYQYPSQDGSSEDTGTNIYLSEQFKVAGSLETPELIYPYKDSVYIGKTSVGDYKTFNNNPQVIFKCYTDEALVNFDGSRLVGAKITESYYNTNEYKENLTKTYTAKVSHSANGLNWFTNVNQDTSTTDYLEYTNNSPYKMSGSCRLLGNMKEILNDSYKKISGYTSLTNMPSLIDSTVTSYSELSLGQWFDAYESDAKNITYDSETNEFIVKAKVNETRFGRFIQKIPVDKNTNYRIKFTLSLGASSSKSSKFGPFGIIVSKPVTLNSLKDASYVRNNSVWFQNETPTDSVISYIDKDNGISPGETKDYTFDFNSGDIETMVLVLDFSGLTEDTTNYIKFSNLEIAKKVSEENAYHYLYNKSIWKDNSWGDFITYRLSRPFDETYNACKLTIDVENGIGLWNSTFDKALTMNIVYDNTLDYEDNGDILYANDLYNMIKNLINNSISSFNFIQSQDDFETIKTLDYTNLQKYTTDNVVKSLVTYYTNIGNVDNLKDFINKESRLKNKYSLRLLLEDWYYLLNKIYNIQHTVLRNFNIYNITSNVDGLKINHSKYLSRIYALPCEMHFYKKDDGWYIPFYIKSGDIEITEALISLDDFGIELTDTTLTDFTITTSFNNKYVERGEIDDNKQGNIVNGDGSGDDYINNIFDNILKVLKNMF